MTADEKYVHNKYMAARKTKKKSAPVKKTTHHKGHVVKDDVYHLKLVVAFVVFTVVFAVLIMQIRNMNDAFDQLDTSPQQVSVPQISVEPTGTPMMNGTGY